MQLLLRSSSLLLLRIQSATQRSRINFNWFQGWIFGNLSILWSAQANLSVAVLAEDMDFASVGPNYRMSISSGNFNDTARSRREVYLCRCCYCCRLVLIVDVAVVFIVCIIWDSALTNIICAEGISNSITREDHAVVGSCSNGIGSLVARQRHFGYDGSSCHWLATLFFVDFQFSIAALPIVPAAERINDSVQGADEGVAIPAGYAGHVRHLLHVREPVKIGWAPAALLVLILPGAEQLPRLAPRERVVEAAADPGRRLGGREALGRGGIGVDGEPGLVDVPGGSGELTQLPRSERQDPPALEEDGGVVSPPSHPHDAGAFPFLHRHDFGGAAHVLRVDPPAECGDRPIQAAVAKRSAAPGIELSRGGADRQVVVVARVEQADGFRYGGHPTEAEEGQRRREIAAPSQAAGACGEQVAGWRSIDRMLAACYR